MNNINNLERCLFTWGGALLLPTLIAGVSYGNPVSFFIFIWLSMVFSAPAFILFSVVFHRVSNRNMGMRKKKGILLLTNYTGIVLTFLLIPYLHKPAFMYDMAGILVCSTAMILLVPPVTFPSVKRKLLNPFCS